MQEPTDREIVLLKEFRNNVNDLCVEKHHLEAKNLLRFLRARNHSLRDAETMFRRQIFWREEQGMDQLLEWNYPKEYRETHWPWRHTGYDYLDNPVALVELGKWDASAVVGNYNDFVKFLLHSNESMWRVMEAKGRGKTTHRQFSAILDLKGLSFRQVTTIDAMQGILEVIKTFEANYPESMRVGIMINSPYVFGIAWSLIKPFLSEYTHSKLKFIGSNPKIWKEEITKYMAEDQFPEKYGGTLPDSHEILIKNGRTIEKNITLTNSNDHIDMTM